MPTLSSAPPFDPGGTSAFGPRKKPAPLLGLEAAAQQQNEQSPNSMAGLDSDPYGILANSISDQEGYVKNQYAQQEGLENARASAGAQMDPQVSAARQQMNREAIGQKAGITAAEQEGKDVPFAITNPGDPAGQNNLINMFRNMSRSSPTAQAADVTGGWSNTTQGTKNAGDLAVKQAEGNNAVGLEDVKQQNALGFFDTLQKAAQGPQFEPGATLKGREGIEYAIPKPAAAGSGAAGNVPPQLERDIQAARASYAANPNSPQAKASLDQAVTNYVIRHPAGQDLKQFARDLSSDQRTAKLPLEQALQVAGEDQLTPDEKNQLAQLLGAIRGF